MLHTVRTTLIVLSTLALAGCGGGDEPAAEAPVANEPASGTAAAPAPAAEPAPAAARGGVLTLADAERVGFARTEPKAFEMVGAVDGAGGTLGGGKVEIYAYAGDVPANRVEELRATAIPAFGWNGFCHVRNLTMVYEKEEACKALRGLD